MSSNQSGRGPPRPDFAELKPLVNICKFGQETASVPPLTAFTTPVPTIKPDFAPPSEQFAAGVISSFSL